MTHHWHRYTDERPPEFGDIVRFAGTPHANHIGVVVLWTVGGASVVWRGNPGAVAAYSSASLEWRGEARSAHHE